jgi:hypothetical protein
MCEGEMAKFFVISKQIEACPKPLDCKTTLGGNRERHQDLGRNLRLGSRRRANLTEHDP